MTNFDVLDWVKYCQKLFSNTQKAEYLLICWVAANPDSSTTEIAKGVNWSYGHVARYLSVLVKEGWLTRTSFGHYKVTGT